LVEQARRQVVQGVKTSVAASQEVLEEVKAHNVVGLGEIRKALKNAYAIQTYHEGHTGAANIALNP
jgi:riboflavin synthase